MSESDPEDEGKGASIDHSEIKGALGSIGMSAILILGATFLSQGLGFVTRITMARYLPVDGYGNVVLGISLLNILGIFALIGLPNALSHFIPRHESEEDRRVTIASGFQIVFFLSIIISLAVIIFAEFIARLAFGNEDLVWIFRIFALILPFYAFFKMSIGGFRGYERTKPQVLTDKILLPLSQLAGIIVFVTIGYGTAGIAFAYAVGFSLVGLVGFAIIYQTAQFSTTDITNIASMSQYRELLTFSLPLASSGVINVIAKNSDMIILGIFRTSTSVGVYEVAFRASMLVIAVFSPAIGYLFQPIISKYDANDDRRQIKQLFTITTRWVVVMTLPIFSLMFLFPEQTISFFFGDDYRQGSLALSILVVGYMFSRLPGLTNKILIATGKTKILMYTSLGTAVLNVVLNLILIPNYGFVGAAIATAGARVLNNIVQSYIIMKKEKIHPFNREYIIPTALIGAVICTIYFLPVSLDKFGFFVGVIISIGLGLLYISFLLLTQSIYDVEAKLADALLERIGLPGYASIVLRPFIR